MTQPSSARPVPGPPRLAGPALSDPDHGSPTDRSPAAEVPPQGDGQDPFAGLDQRPADEHVTVFEAEHERLQRRLGGIDQV